MRRGPIHWAQAADADIPAGAAQRLERRLKLSVWLRREDM